MNEADKFTMKKELLWILLSIIVIVIMAFTAGGCVKTPETSKTTIATVTTGAATTKATTTIVPTTTAASTTIKTTATPTVTQGSIGNDPWVKMENVLKNLGINYEKKWMYAEAIGAKEGNKYSTTKGTYEMYLYDTGSDAYKAAVKSNAMNLSGTLFPATIRDGYALYFYPNVTENVKNQIIEAFFK